MKYIYKKPYQHQVVESLVLKEYLSKDLYHEGYSKLKCYYDIRERKIVSIYTNYDPVYVKEGVEHDFGNTEIKETIIPSGMSENFYRNGINENIPLETSLVKKVETFNPETGRYSSPEFIFNKEEIFDSCKLERKRKN